MRIPWKLIGIAGVAGVTATGVVVARHRRETEAVDPDELRARLHQRLAEAERPEGAGRGGGTQPPGHPA